MDHSAILANEHEVTYDDELEDQLRQLYIEEVEYTDGVLGDFLDGVRDVVNRPISIIFTSNRMFKLQENC